MPSWNEFLTEYVKAWRNSFEKLGEAEKNSILASYRKHYVFLEPCQIEVIASKKPLYVLWIVTWDENRKDMEFIIHSDVEVNLKSFFNERRTEDPVWFKRFDQIANELKDIEKFFDPKFPSSLWAYGRDFTFMYVNYDLLGYDPRKFAHDHVEDAVKDALRDFERKAIGERAEEIKSEAEKVLDENLRSKLLKAAKEIETSLGKMKRLDEHEQKIAAIEGEIAGVRKLIGRTKEYQDWKVLVEDVTEFKKTPHVTKDLFDSEIKRLDQRIDALKEIKFWSRRTIIDLVLGVIATASTIIAALLAAGIIHF